MKHLQKYRVLEICFENIFLVCSKNLHHIYGLSHEYALYLIASLKRPFLSHDVIHNIPTSGVTPPPRIIMHCKSWSLLHPFVNVCYIMPMEF